MFKWLTDLLNIEQNPKFAALPTEMEALQAKVELLEFRLRELEQREPAPAKKDEPKKLRTWSELRRLAREATEAGEPEWLKNAH